MRDTALLVHAVTLASIAWAVAIAVGWLLCFLARFKERRTRQEVGRPPSTHHFFYRFGGLVLAAGFFGALFFDNRLVSDTRLQILIVGSLLALAIGMYDDWRPLHWSYQLLGQLLLGGMLLSSGMKITHLDLGAGMVVYFDAVIPFLSGIITLWWVVLVMNATNWVDGADGLVGGVIGVALLVLAWLSWQPPVYQPTLTLLTLMLGGALLGFLCFNWYPARLIAGSGGVNFLGFLLAAFSVYAGAKVATALLVLTIPVLDLFSVILARLRKGRSPFLPDQSHLHHILLSRGFSPRGIAGIYILFTGVMGMLSLVTKSMGKFYVFLLAGIVFFSVLGWMHWGVAKKEN